MAVHIKLIKNNIKSSKSYGKYFAKASNRKYSPLVATKIPETITLVVSGNSSYMIQ